MSGWDSAANGSAQSNSQAGLCAPLLGGDGSSSSSSSGGGGGGPANGPVPAGGGLIAPHRGRGVPQRRATQPATAPQPTSTVSDEVLHGGGTGLKLLYAAHTEEEFESHMAQERERDIERTATNVRLVNEVFNELGQLVTTQQADVDTIESQIQTATDRTTAGMDQLDKAVKGQSKLNSCYFNCLGLLLLAFVVIFVFLFWDQITGSDDDGR